jgi:AraC-like DNA-binding protein
MYREFAPSAGLAELVECVWRHEIAEPGGDATGVVLPDGRVDVIWTDDGRSLVAGPQTTFLARPLRPPFVALGVRFRPGIGPPLLGLSAHELVDLHVPLADVDTRAAGVLRGRLAAAVDPLAAVEAFEDGVAALADHAGGRDPAVAGATRLLEESRATVSNVSRELWLSERQLERRFRASVGYGPKTLQRVLRFQRVMRALRRGGAGDGGLARIAAAAGYADQAHMTRECRALSGLSPAQLARRWRG